MRKWREWSFSLIMRCMYGQTNSSRLTESILWVFIYDWTMFKTLNYGYFVYMSGTECWYMYSKLWLMLKCCRLHCWWSTCVWFNVFCCHFVGLWDDSCLDFSTVWVLHHPLFSLLIKKSKFLSFVIKTGRIALSLFSN